MKSSTTRPDHGGLNVSFPLSLLPASGLDEISKKKRATVDRSKDLPGLLESSQTTACQESFVNTSSAAAVSEALALLGSMANGSLYGFDLSSTEQLAKVTKAEVRLEAISLSDLKVY
jgi:hypothetical protein